MKKQITVIVSVALATILLFVSYSVFFKDDGIQRSNDPFYVLTPSVETAVSEIEKNVEIVLVNYDAGNKYWDTTEKFVQAFYAVNDDITVSHASDGNFTGLRVVVDGQTKEIPFDSLFRFRFDGERYAFDGEKLIFDAMASLCGMESLAVEPRALEGFDLDGDTVTSDGKTFIFPSIDRSQIAMLVMNNEHGQYTIFQENGKFYFGSSRMITYDDEMFSMVTTNCRYPLAVGKMQKPAENTWETYGLGDNSEPTAIYSIATLDDEQGNYVNHTVIVGNKASSGSYYYARYLGAKYKRTKDDKGETVPVELESYSKDVVYMIDSSVVLQSFVIPETDLMKPSVMNVVTKPEAVYSIDNIRIDYFDENITALAKNISSFNPAPNLSAVDNSAITKVLGDKTNAKADYKFYEGGWSNNINVFAGFTSSDGKSTYIDGAVMRTAPNGEYKITFGLLRDQAGKALLPDKVSVMYSSDRTNWHNAENGIILPQQADGTLKRYELSFKTETNVKYIRLNFDVPQTAYTYVVFDEIRIYADGLDAQPNEAITGTWKLVTPASYIPSGRNFANLDLSNFGTFIQSIAALEGDKVVGCGFSKEGDASPALLNKEILAKFGLDNPNRHYAFEYDGVVCDFYVSKPNDKGNCYAYSTFTANVEGKVEILTTDVIVEISPETASWLNWDFTEFLDHTLFSIYLDDCTEVDVTVGGKEEFKFNIEHTEDGTISKITESGKELDIQSFRYLYQDILDVNMQKEYVPSEGENPVEMFRVKIVSESNDPEIVFYRVSSAKCYFTVDGEGSYYVLADEVNQVINSLRTYVDGGKLTK